VPEIKVGIRDLIVNAERERFRSDALWESRSETKWTSSTAPNGDILSPTIFLKKESLAQAMAAGRDEQIWLIDFDETLRGLGVSVPPEA